VGENGQIEEVGKEDLPTHPDTIVKDAGGRMILPGFIDMHVHGGGGFSGMAGRDSVIGMSCYHARNGTTAFAATTTSAAMSDILFALGEWRNVAEAGKTQEVGAELVGFHLEGPFINPVRGGAQSKTHLLLPSNDSMKCFLDAAGGWMKLVTLAPELPGAESMIRLLRDEGITVSAGHTDASFEQMQIASSLGVTHMTHHFNGMRPISSREPGATGAGLMLPELTIEMIVDGYHIHPEMVAMAFNLKSKDRIALVTDAIVCAGLPDGLYAADGYSFRMNGGRVMLEDGSSLAGSGLNMLQALRNAVRFTGRTVEQILPALTSVPARQLALQDRKGMLVPGMDADFIVVDENWQLLSTHVRGRKVFDARRPL
jgi:N-acetylglucosamine-6-phosphate deacetylase